MRRRLRPPAGLATVATVAVIVAGCGNAPAGTATGNSTRTSAHAKAVKFAECMRNNGISGFPDPNASGQLTIDAVANGSSIDTNSAAWMRAIDTCKSLEPAGFTGAKVTPQLRTARLKFAQCVRDNGVPDFPDPADNQPLVDTNLIPSTSTPAGMSALNAAMHRCGNLAAAAGVTEGR